MSSHGHTPGPTGALRSLAEVQLQVQASRAASLDARAIGVMGIDAALATIIGGTGFAEAPQVVSLVMLSLSAGLALRCLLLDTGERMGPSLARLLDLHKGSGNAATERSMLEWMIADLRMNERALAHKAPPLTNALFLMAFAVMLALAGSV